MVSIYLFVDTNLFTMFRTPSRLNPNLLNSNPGAATGLALITSVNFETLLVYLQMLRISNRCTRCVNRQDVECNPF